MRLRRLVPRVLLGVLAWCATGTTHGTPGETSPSLREVFLNPPDEAKPRGYWVWPHGNFDYGVIRHELAEFKAKGLGGVDIFDLGVQDRRNVIPPGPGFMSAEQVDGIAFALDEARRLGLKLGLIVSSSWNAGGTWTPPELAMMNLVAWQEEVTGPRRYERVLPLPELPESFRKPYGTFPLFPPKDTNGVPLYLKPVAVLAYPLAAEGHVADPTQVRLLNDRVDAAGKLTCDLPAGRWVVMRAVLANFGQRLWLPSDRSQGLTMDHFNKEATRHHFGTIIERLEARVGPLKDTALERLYLASYEANAGVIWTPGFEEAFHRQNGYRIEPFLPALYGVVMVDRDMTDRFLYDYRKTVSELFIENLYREASRLCRQHGLLLCSEAGGPGAPLHDVPAEELTALGAVDVMRGEFWHGKTNQLTPDGFEELQVVKPIGSAAHIYGHRVVEMEAFTSHANWNEGVEIFRPLADRAFCEGMTRVVYHTMSHNLPEAGLPGWTYQAGTHLSTAQTWWELSGQLHAYLARCSALLMQGEFVADVAAYYGDAVPNFARPKHLRPGLGYGYDYDDLNTEMLLQARVDGRGRVTLPSGMSYAVLTLPENDRRMDLAVLRQLERLVRDGATIIGERPERAYGLRRHPVEEQELHALAATLWGETAVGPVERNHGRGRIIAGKPVRDVLREQGLGPDFDVSPTALRGQIDFIHRRTAHEDIYFIRNAGANAVRFEATFRVRGRQPELWDAVRGTMTPVAAFVGASELSSEQPQGTAKPPTLPLTPSLSPSEGERVPDSSAVARWAKAEGRERGLLTPEGRGEGRFTDGTAGTRVPLHLDGQASVFVVFTQPQRKRPHVVAISRAGQSLFPNRDPDAPGFTAHHAPDGSVHFDATAPGDYELHQSNGQTSTATVLLHPLAMELTGPWEVRFPYGWDVPVRQEFEQLHSWTDSTNAATRAFSGLASYAKQFELTTGALPPGSRVVLDLGEVREVARVFLNGREVGLSTFAPHTLDVTALIRHGENSLVVEVANTWLNRLIADDALPEAERKTHTNLSGPVGAQRWRDAKPRPSGLLGPVHLRFPRETVVN